MYDIVKIMSVKMIVKIIVYFVLLSMIEIGTIYLFILVDKIDKINDLGYLLFIMLGHCPAGFLHLTYVCFVDCVTFNMIFNRYISSRMTKFEICRHILYVSIYTFPYLTEHVMMTKIWIDIGIENDYINNMFGSDDLIGYFIACFFFVFINLYILALFILYFVRFYQKIRPDNNNNYDNNNNINIIVNNVITQNHYIYNTNNENFKYVKKNIIDLNIIANKLCTICLADFDISEINNITMLKCNHVYHDTCINNWFNIKNSCPLCLTFDV